MIELPTFAVPGSFAASFIDAGFTQSAMQSDDYIPRKGGRYSVGFTFGPYTPDEGRVMVSRLIAGKQGGLRVRLPLLHSQGSPGNPTVAFASGRVLSLAGLTANYPALEGFWLSITANGRSYLHSIGVGATADGGGSVEVELNELLRDTIPVGSAVNLAAPVVEGLVQGDEASWNASVNRVIPIEFSIKERR